ncbi:MULTISPECIES: class I adenylate-forming enzyme family protein [unclassified Streptomyces]|uniref:class I adenylate-forming enzyme family protein n=1 Tax=unclassified Streptomyces TaxID=2593676 RepID=UPI000F454A70|nr:class I adenylate-forming enzyme family protein [Streptomyces sp. I6]RNL72751.1 long-chain fatty acid--CoA ligase [Streptomyces sp. I6]
MATFAATVLTPKQREQLAADSTVGGGNLLRSAIAANPRPELPFVHSYRAITTTSGEQTHDLSLNDIDALAQSWSVYYLAQGVRRGDRVAVWFEDSFAYSVHYYAIAQIGAVAVLINSNATGPIARSLLEQTAPVGLYADRERLALLDTTLLPSIAWTRTAEELPAPPAARLADGDYWNHHADDPVVILHSSGTTGRPKPTIHTHSTIVAGPRFRLVDHTETPGALMMTALPQSHLGCVAYTTYAVLGGTPIVALSDRKGDELAAAVEKYRPTSVMSFAHGYAELASADLKPGQLDSVQVWVSIGDAVHRAHIDKVLKNRSAELPPSAFFDRLGTTELGWGCLLQVHTLDNKPNNRCAGKPVGVAEVAILRPDGSIADPGEVGYLAARGPAVTPGYWGDSATTYSFRMSGYWMPGDMAYRDENGDFYLVDRAVDAIHTARGTGYSVFMEEVVLLQVPEVEDVAVVAGRDGEAVVPVAVVTAAESAEPEKLLLLANEALRAAGHPELGFLEIAASQEDFPVGVTGKVLKRQLREKYAALSEYRQSAQGRSFAAVNPGDAA